MLQADEPDTFVLATGHTVTVRDFVELACDAADIPIALRARVRAKKASTRAPGKPLFRLTPNFIAPLRSTCSLVMQRRPSKHWAGKPPHHLRPCAR